MDGESIHVIVLVGLRDCHGDVSLAIETSPMSRSISGITSHGRPPRNILIATTISGYIVV